MGARVAGLNGRDGAKASLSVGGDQTVPQGTVDRQKRCLHSFHEEQVAGAGESEEIVEFGERAGDRLLAENRQAGFERGAGEAVVGVR